MIQYLIILLDDTATSYCHYNVPEVPKKLIALEDLKKGILYAMKENLTIQFVYPDYLLPPEYVDVIETIDHVKIKPSSQNASEADIFVINGVSSLVVNNLLDSGTFVLRIEKDEFFSNVKLIADVIQQVKRLNVVFSDIETFNEGDFVCYKSALEQLSEYVENMYVNMCSPQINLLTDRMLLKQMNNCNAGDTNITLAPDGRFYPCPAFYYETTTNPFMGLGGPKEKPFSIGDLDKGLDIKNPQLYKRTHAPLCRICDAFQCKRCVWLNWKLTREVNTPSHEQCVISHLERNASKSLLDQTRRHGSFLPDQDIKEIDYLDPFDVKEEW